MPEHSSVWVTLIILKFITFYIQRQKLLLQTTFTYGKWNKICESICINDEVKISTVYNISDYICRINYWTYYWQRIKLMYISYFRPIVFPHVQYYTISNINICAFLWDNAWREVNEYSISDWPNSILWLMSTSWENV